MADDGWSESEQRPRTFAIKTSLIHDKHGVAAVKIKVANAVGERQSTTVRLEWPAGAEESDVRAAGLIICASRTKALVEALEVEAKALMAGG